MTATGAEAGNNLVPAGPVRSTAAEAAATVQLATTEQSTAEQSAAQQAATLQAATQQAATERGGGTAARRQLMLRATITGILGVLAGTAAWFLLQHGVSTDAFPPFLTGTDATAITRYSGPWITAAAAAGLLAALLLLSTVLDLRRSSKAGPRSSG